MSHGRPHPEPERVPYRGTHYVAASAFDALSQALDEANRDNDALRRRNADLLTDFARVEKLRGPLVIPSDIGKLAPPGKKLTFGVAVALAIVAGIIIGVSCALLRR